MIYATFKNFPEEAGSIGRILAGYTDLEFALAHTINVARDDFDAVIKTLYRARGETARINIADGLGKQTYHDLNLGKEFEYVINSIRFCLKIRNLFSHCIWWEYDDGKTLAYANLEEVANLDKRVNDLSDLTVRFVDVPLLKSHEDFYHNTDHYFLWLMYEARYRKGERKSNPHKEPKQLAQPPLDTH